MITDDSLENFLQVRGFSKGMVGCSEASTHLHVTHATLPTLHMLHSLAPFS
jgi:hypothetical protein